MEDASPFKRFRRLAKRIRTAFKSSPMGTKRKVTPLTQGQIAGIVENMAVGGFTMMQVRARALSVSLFPSVSVSLPPCPSFPLTLSTPLCPPVCPPLSRHSI